MMKRTLACLALAAATAAPLAAQPNPLVAARELYASARYDEALAMLNGLSPADAGNPLERRYVEQYRSLCLLALGRGSEAEQAIAAVVTADPAYRPSEAEASPRVSARRSPTFASGCCRTLPGPGTPTRKVRSTGRSSPGRTAVPQPPGAARRSATWAVGSPICACSCRDSST